MVDSPNSGRALDQLHKHFSQVRGFVERMSAINLRAFIVQGLDGLKHLRRGLPDLTHSASGEQKVVRIDVTLLDEAAGLLGTSARVRFVYQSALVVHEVAQVATSTGQPLTKILRGDFQQIGADSIAYAEDHAEDVRQTLLAIEAKQHT